MSHETYDITDGIPAEIIVKDEIFAEYDSARIEPPSRVILTFAGISVVLPNPCPIADVNAIADKLRVALPEPAADAKPKKTTKNGD